MSSNQPETPAIARSSPARRPALLPNPITTMSFRKLIPFFRSDARLLRPVAPVWFLIFVVTMFAAFSQAATIVWSGASGTDTNWSNGNNWAGLTAPGGGDDARFFDTGTNLTVG